MSVALAVTAVEEALDQLTNARSWLSEVTRANGIASTQDLAEPIRLAKSHVGFLLKAIDLFEMECMADSTGDERLVLDEELRKCLKLRVSNPHKKLRKKATNGK